MASAAGERSGAMVRRIAAVAAQEEAARLNVAAQQAARDAGLADCAS
jgi:hypothetical protein